jgi:hypothetical protein
MVRILATIALVPRSQELLTDVFVGQFVGKTNSLRVVFNGFSVHDSDPELFHDRLVNRIALQGSQLSRKPGDQVGRSCVQSLPLCKHLPAAPQVCCNLASFLSAWCIPAED